MNIPPDQLMPRLERLIKAKGHLTVMHGGGSGLGLYWSANIGGWPYCSGGTLEQALDDLVFTHARLEREELQKRINEIDGSSNL